MYVKRPKNHAMKQYERAMTKQPLEQNIACYTHCPFRKQTRCILTTVALLEDQKHKKYQAGHFHCEHDEIVVLEYNIIQYNIVQ